MQRTELRYCDYVRPAESSTKHHESINDVSSPTSTLSSTVAAGTDDNGGLSGK